MARSPDPLCPGTNMLGGHVAGPGRQVYCIVCRQTLPTTDGWVPPHPSPPPTTGHVPLRREAAASHQEAPMAKKAVKNVQKAAAKAVKTVQKAKKAEAKAEKLRGQITKLVARIEKAKVNMAERIKGMTARQGKREEKRAVLAARLRALSQG